MKKIVGNDNVDINRTIYNLNQIISENRAIIIPDTNVLVPGNFLYETYATKDYSCLNIEDLICMQECIKIGFLLLEHPNTCIPLNVVNEVECFLNIISERMGYYNKSIPILRKGYKQSFNTQEKIRLYKEIGELSHILFKTAKRLHKSKDFGDYSNLFEIVLMLSKNFELKEDKSYRESLEPKKDRSEHKFYDTDEEIIALALYLSINKNKSCTILSEDRDVTKILRCSSEFLKSEDLSNKMFSSSLAKYPITIYNPIVKEISYSYPVFSTIEMDNQNIIGLSMNREEIIDFAKGDSGG